MSDTINWKNYFDKNSRSWIDEAYKDAEYTYPVGAHRLRILKKLVATYDLSGKGCLDIGCGGGDISFFLASQGCNVVGIDMSKNMLAIAEKTRNDISKKSVRNNITFIEANFNSLPETVTKNKYDLIVAFGLIGYLDSDEKFFKIIDDISLKGTKLLLSCRNRLFNITSISPNTVNEIENGTAKKLIDEIDKYYSTPLSEEHTKLFIQQLNYAISSLNGYLEYEKASKYLNETLPGTGINQPRSSTPKDLNNTALQFGFKNVSMHGIHPHILLPRMNKLLPPRVFNVLSDALCAYEDDPISLIYSSVYIGEFEKVCQ